MDWEKAFERIISNIHVGLLLDTDCAYNRPVVNGPNYACNRYDYEGVLGFKIRIGETDYVEVPINMLETLFKEAIINNRVYNGKIFQLRYLRQHEQHGCHVHVVGKIFEHAGVAVKRKRNYIIL